MFANVTNKLFISSATSFAGIPVPKLVSVVTADTATVPVTAVDTDAIGIVLRAGCPGFDIDANTINLALNSCRVSIRDSSVSWLADVASVFSPS